MIELELLKDKTEWNEFVSASRYGTLFHTWEWISLLEDIYKVKKLPIGIFEKDNLIGVFPTFIQKKVFLKLAMSPLHTAATPYGGPLPLRGTLPKNILEEFEEFLRDYATDYIEFLAVPGIEIENLLRESNYIFRERMTYILDLTKGVDVIWKNLEQRCRRAIRKAKKNNVEIVEGENKKQLNEFYKMTEDTYKKWGKKPPISREYFRKVWDLFHDKKRVKFLFAKYEGRLIAGAIFPIYRDDVYYWNGGAYREYYRVAPNNLIHWHLIEWALNNGLKKYDMVGADIPSIAKFKASFSGEKVRHIYAYKFKSPLAKIGRKVYEKWKKGFV